LTGSAEHAKAEIAKARQEADEARKMWQDAEDEADKAEAKATMAKRLVWHALYFMRCFDSYCEFQLLTVLHRSPSL
jgi:hypothetical protein